MAYQQVPERTTADTNSPDDINQLQDNFDSFLDSAGNFTRGGGVNQLSFSLAGDAFVDTGIQKLVFATATSFNDWILRSDEAPDATLAIDVNKNGTSIFGATAFQILAGSTVATLAQTVSFAKNDTVSWDIDSIGTNTAGGNFLMVSGV
jgi:hypothetical protein